LLFEVATRDKPLKTVAGLKLPFGTEDLPFVLYLQYLSVLRNPLFQGIASTHQKEP
jgi:hypothetical protein